MSRAALVALLTVLLAACAGTGSAPAAPAGPPPPIATAAPAAPAPRPGAFPVPPGSTIVVDPGHNGGNARAAAIARPVPDGRGSTKPCNTTGAATADGYAEHAFTWAVSQRLAALLRERGFRVVLTRPDDTGVGPCVDVRGEAGRASGRPRCSRCTPTGRRPPDTGSTSCTRHRL